MRFYGFESNEIVVAQDGMLDLDIDPKLAWALANRDAFPVDVNVAERATLLRVPGLGVRNVKRILATRRRRALRYVDLVKLRCDVEKAKAFIIPPDWRPAAATQPSSTLRAALTAHARQLPLL
jgi:predicted DNA-binding helix-hairpin-helix protein